MMVLDYGALRKYARETGADMAIEHGSADARYRAGLRAMRDEPGEVAEAFGCVSGESRREFSEALCAWIAEVLDEEEV